MDKDALLSRINALASTAIGGLTESSAGAVAGDDLSSERAEAIDRYFGRPYGDEIDGRSAVVSRDLAEAVDWIMPSIMRVFLTSGDVVEFQPTGPEDVKLAEQETEYTNYVMLRENQAFIYLHDWFKDALILRNGYVKAYWEENETSRVEEYTDLSDASLLKLLTDLDGKDVDILGHQESEQTINGQPVLAHDIKIRINEKSGRVKIEAVPVEEVRISKHCKGDLETADYVEHRTVKTRTALLEMGLPPKFVEGLPKYTAALEAESTARDRYGESDSKESADASMDDIEYREVCIRIDWDGDGKGELRRVVVAGQQIPDGEEWNREIEFQYLCHAVPKRMPHRHVGESLHDELADIAQIKTILTRGLLDNTYGLTNGEFIINERANLDDFLVSKPLGVKRIEGTQPVTGACEPINKPNILSQILPAIDYIDGVKAKRTGIVPYSATDPDLLKEVRQGPYQEQLHQANAKVEMICRMFAEIGLKPLALKVHALLCKHQDQPKLVRLRNQFIPVDPRQWKQRMDMQVTVGLGNGNREETKDTIAIIQAGQAQLANFGLVGPKHAYAAFVDLVKALGKPNPETYAINPDPDNPEFQQVMAAKQPPPNPLAEVEMIKQQSTQMIAKMEMDGKMQMETMKNQMETQLRQQEAQTKAGIEQMQIQMAASQKMAITKLQEDNKRAIAILNAEVQLLVAGQQVDVGEPGVGGEMRKTIQVMPSRMYEHYNKNMLDLKDTMLMKAEEDRLARAESQRFRESILGQIQQLDS